MTAAQMYQDRLVRRISAEMYDRLAHPMKQEQADVERALADHRSEKPTSHVLNGALVLEVAAIASALFEMQSPREKRKLLNIVLSNSIWDRKQLAVNYRQPFDLFAE